MPSGEWDIMSQVEKCPSRETEDVLKLPVEGSRDNNQECYFFPIEMSWLPTVDLEWVGLLSQLRIMSSVALQSTHQHWTGLEWAET